MSLSAAEIKVIQIKCEALMTKFAPEKPIGNVKKALDTAFKGREADLLKDLTVKYDPPKIPTPPGAKGPTPPGSKTPPGGKTPPGQGKTPPGAPAAAPGKKAPAVKVYPYTTRQVQYVKRLIRFFNKYAPDRLGEVNAKLEAAIGKEEFLFVALTREYGPEPPDTDIAPGEGGGGGGVGEDFVAMAKNENWMRRRTMIMWLSAALHERKFEAMEYRRRDETMRLATRGKMLTVKLIRTQVMANRAAKAAAEGRFDEEIVEVVNVKGEVVLAADEGVRASSTIESLGKLRAAFATPSASTGIP